MLRNSNKKKKKKRSGWFSCRVHQLFACFAQFLSPLFLICVFPRIIWSSREVTKNRISARPSSRSVCHPTQREMARFDNSNLILLLQGCWAARLGWSISIGEPAKLDRQSEMESNWIEISETIPNELKLILRTSRNVHRNVQHAQNKKKSWWTC